MYQFFLICIFYKKAFSLIILSNITAAITDTPLPCHFALKFLIQFTDRSKTLKTWVEIQTFEDYKIAVNPAKEEKVREKMYENEGQDGQKMMKSMKGWRRKEI